MKTVYATTLHFPSEQPKTTAQEIWNEVLSWVEGWYQRNAEPISIEQEKDIQEIYPVQKHLIRASVHKSDDEVPMLRELMWQYPDQYDSTLMWRSEVTVFTTETGAHLTMLIRILGASFEITPVRFKLGTPRLVRDLLDQREAYVGDMRLRSTPQKVESAEDVEDLVGILLSRERRAAVVVISPLPWSEKTAVDPARIAMSVAGLANVYVLENNWVGFQFTDHVGKELSCYYGAVRIYWPGFSLDSDPLRHPYYLPKKIESMGGSDRFGYYLLRFLASVSSFRWAEPPALRRLRRELRERERRRLRESVEKSRDYDELMKLWLETDEENKRLHEELEELKIENENLRANLNAVWKMEPEMEEGEEEMDEEEPEPQSVLEAVEMARARAKHTIFLDEAFESAEDSPYKHPDRVYKALMAIDDVAGRWARSLEDGTSWGNFRDAFSKWGFEYKHRISQTSRGKWRSDYTYTYKDKKIIFEPHITLGAGQPDTNLSIHMYWDEEDRKVVVAHVGRHKRNTKT